MTTILLVEDTYDLAQVIARELETNGYQVLHASDGLTALRLQSREHPALVVLDWMLPKMDGLEVLRRIRQVAATPVLMLTARDEEADRVIGLELGADDYLTKPFSPRELVARVRAVLRRAEPGPPESRVIEVGELRVAVRTRSATFAGSPLALRALEFELLAELARNAGHVVTRDRLLDRVWGVSFAGGTRTVDVHVAQLRKKLGRPELIQTVRGYGYR